MRLRRTTWLMTGAIMTAATVTVGPNAWSTPAQSLGRAAPAALSAAPPGESSPAALACPDLAPTIKGTRGNDHLVGTQGRDIIDGAGGSDVIEGLGGDDVLIGGNAADKLLGGPGNDVLCGENADDLLIGGSGDDLLIGESGSDLLSGGFGNDQLVGLNGEDRLAGGPGDDKVWGDKGQDRLGGGPGDDTLSGGSDQDWLGGGEGTDSAAGWRGADACAAESKTTCETDFVEGARTAQLSAVREAEDGSGWKADWSVTAQHGIRLVEFYANAEVISHQEVSGTSAAGTVAIPLSELQSGSQSTLFVVVTDSEGQQTGSQAQSVSVPESEQAASAATSVRLSSPTPIADLVKALTEAGLQPLAYTASNVPAPAPQADPQLLAQMEAAGVEPYVPQEQAVLYEPGSTPLAAQAEELAEYYQHQHITGTALISLVTVQGDMEQSELGGLGQLGRIDRGEPASDARRGARKPEPETQPQATVPEKTDRTASPALARQIAAAEPDPDFWPVFGRMNISEYSATRWRPGFGCSNFILSCGPQIVRSEQAKAEVQHQVVFDPRSLQQIEDRPGAYEHNLVMKSPGRRFRRPACNPFTNDDFYMRAGTGSLSITNAPSSANFYNDDVDYTDDCSSSDVTWGMAYPGRILDNVPAGKFPVILANQTSDRKNDTDRSFVLVAQSLTRSTCPPLTPGFLMKQCIGINTGATQGATLARTGSTSLGNVTLPACVVYQGQTVREGTNSSVTSSLCSGDSDGDGFDDRIDCAPNDPAINPGAVDIPNDGVDQNCDGSDLQVGEGQIRVTLIWDNDNDQDLHVVEPSGREIWYRATGPTSTGGRLDRDDNVNLCGRDAEPGGVENVYWPSDATPDHGTYTVNVVEYSTCGVPAEWTALVYQGDRLIKTETGSRTGGFQFTY